MGLIFKPEKCVGCEMCSLVCSLKHHNVTGLQMSRIKISRNYPSLEDPLFEATYCRQCKNARCIQVCPTGALSRRDTGDVVFDAQKCTKCGECITACPFNAIWADEKSGKIFKCDLCDGQPWCVDWCPHDALIYK
jgi:Fe-S-cluster-containing dehydrogenase component